MLEQDRKEEVARAAIRAIMRTYGLPNVDVKITTDPVLHTKRAEITLHVPLQEISTANSIVGPVCKEMRRIFTSEAAKYPPTLEKEIPLDEDPYQIPLFSREQAIDKGY